MDRGRLLALSVIYSDFLTDFKPCIITRVLIRLISCISSHGTSRKVTLLVIIHYNLACITKARRGYGRAPARHPRQGHTHQWGLLRKACW